MVSNVDNELLKKLLNDVLEQEKILRLYAVFAVFESKCKKSAERKRKREDPEDPAVNSKSSKTLKVVRTLFGGVRRTCRIKSSKTKKQYVFC